MSNDKRHWDESKERFLFEKVDRPDDPEMAERASLMAVFACTDLGILRHPKLVWIRPGNPASTEVRARGPVGYEVQEVHQPRFTFSPVNMAGFTPIYEDLYEFWMRADLYESPKLEMMVAHELRHVWQKLQNLKAFADPSQEALASVEGDAYPYAFHLLRLYFQQQGLLTTELREKIDRMNSAYEEWYYREYPRGTYQILEGPFGGN